MSLPIISECELCGTIYYGRKEKCSYCKDWTPEERNHYDYLRTEEGILEWLRASGEMAA